ncbi:MULTISPECIES: hypothetical protein [Yersinia]|uniref:hypothetical protein n=1 Tax=Yersinia TaxID=629 RepID=UPI0005E338D6|nr:MULTISPECIES: hypothetical protein [Yersinia]OVZ96234.1 hypothetical protein CBW53_16495 [Yersinia frederiksenii]RXA98051.1 hypothetical protein EQP49_00455 [Yersinia sp. 2105 StPb PI]CNH97733.1 Uncharacterised protein [Yersinia frederiksenii]CNI04696.1 Uncharacterised protein [Yersinia frederiksenii]CNK09773.1 Uncharacterised protein [Yersinia frederiksenii]
MKFITAILIISAPVFSLSMQINEPIAVPAITRVSEAVCNRNYVNKEYIACIKLVDSSLLKAYWAGKMNVFCQSKFNDQPSKEKQCITIMMISNALDEMGSHYLEE